MDYKFYLGKHVLNRLTNSMIEQVFEACDYEDLTFDQLTQGNVFHMLHYISRQSELQGEDITDVAKTAHQIFMFEDIYHEYFRELQDEIPLVADIIDDICSGIVIKRIKETLKQLNIDDEVFLDEEIDDMFEVYAPHVAILFCDEESLRERLENAYEFYKQDR